MKTIILLSTGQPSTNPRLVKEADALSAAGYRVIVLYCHWSDWAISLDKKLLAAKNWQAVLVGGNKKYSPITYYFSRLRSKICRKVAEGKKYFNNIAERAVCRSFDELLHEVKQIKADLYIAHNLGALPVAVLAAKYHKTSSGYDAEDYYMGQFSCTSSTDYLLTKYIEGKYLPSVNYVTAASPLITQVYKEKYPNLNPVTINNVFPLLLQPAFKKKLSNDKLTLFWFSQTIGKNRGLEEVIQAVGLLQNKIIEIHLLGFCSSLEKEYFLSIAKVAQLAQNQLNFLDPIHSDKLVSVSSGFDIGLASEIPYCVNRDICLTNKIFTYILAGNAIVASNTQAQQQLLNQYSDIGKIYTIGNTEQLASIIDFYFHHKEALQICRQNAWNLGKKLMNWDEEKISFLNLISETINKSEKPTNYFS